MPRHVAKRGIPIRWQDAPRYVVTDDAILNAKALFNRVTSNLFHYVACCFHAPRLAAKFFPCKRFFHLTRQVFCRNIIPSKRQQLEIDRMTTKPKATGHRIGDWFLWIDCEVAKTDSYRKIPIVTVRDAVRSGDILSTVVATREMAKELRSAADGIEAVLDGFSADNRDLHNAA